MVAGETHHFFRKLPTYDSGRIFWLSKSLQLSLKTVRRDESVEKKHKNMLYKVSPWQLISMVIPCNFIRFNNWSFGWTTGKPFETGLKKSEGVTRIENSCATVDGSEILHQLIW